MATAVRGPMVTTVARPKLRRKNMFSVNFGFFMAVGIAHANVVFGYKIAFSPILSSRAEF